MKPGLRLTRIDRYLLGSLLRPGLICFGVTLVMMLLERADRLINQIAAGGGEVHFFFPLMVNEVPYYLGLALPAAFFISMFIVIIRMDEGAEVEAMQSSGLSLARITAPWVGVGLVVAMVSLLILGFLEPYGHYGFRSVQNLARQAGWSGKLRSGAFVTSDRTSTIVADSADPTGKSLGGLFISRMMPGGGESVITAATAVLSDGPHLKSVRLALRPARAMVQHPDGAVQVARFEDLVLFSPRGADSVMTARGGDVRELTLPELVRARSAPVAGLSSAAVDAELYSRLGRALSAPFLPLLALPLGVVSKRGRRTPGLIVAGLVLVLFHHGVVLVGSLAALGKLDPLLGVGGLFAGFVVFSLWLFFGSLKRPGDTPLSGILEGLALGVENLGRRFGEWRGTLRPGRARTRARPVSLQAYVARQLVVRTLTAAAVIVTLLQIFELLGRAGDILARGVGLGGLGYYMLLQTPDMVRQGVGFAMFAGLVVTLMGLARSGEMTAMRAAGVSLRQLIVMLLPVVLMVGVIDLVIADQIAPRTERATQQWLQATALPGARAEVAPRWFKAGQDIVRADRATDQGRLLQGVRIYRRGAGFQLSERITARSAALGPHGWVLSDAQTLTVRPDGSVRSASPLLAWPTSLLPDEVIALFQPTLQISAFDALRGLHGGAANMSAGFLWTRLFRLLAEPAAPLVMLLLAAPIVLVHGRAAGRFGSVLYGVGGGLAYLVADGLLTASGQTGELPALVAAWAAPFVFAMAAFTVLLYVEL